MFLHSAEGTFTHDAKARVAAELTDLGIACEGLKDIPRIRAGVWVYFVDHARTEIFRAGAPADQPTISLKTYALAGGLDRSAKKRFIEQATKIVGRNADRSQGEVPVYVGIIEIPEENWGMYGEPVRLADMKA